MELVLGVSLAAVVLLAAHSLVETCLLADSRSEEAFDSSQTLRILTSEFVSDIENARNEAAFPDFKFAGDGTSLTMCTTVPQAYGKGGSKSLVSVEYTYDESGKVLYRAEKSLFGIEQPATQTASTQESQDQPEGSGFKAVTPRFSYLSGDEWLTEWSGDTLPDAVKLEASGVQGLGKGRDSIVLSIPALK